MEHEELNWPVKPFVMTEADKEFAEHMNSLSQRELEMMDGVELGGIKAELTTAEIVDRGIAACPPELLQEFADNLDSSIDLIRRFLERKIDQLQEAANKGVPSWDSPEGRANSNLAHDIWGVLRWLKTISK